MQRTIEIKNKDLCAKIETLGAQLVSLKDEKEEYMWQRDENVWGYCSPVVFPICGGLNEGRYIFNNKEYSMMQHGFARFKEFEVEKHIEDEAVFLLKADSETKKIYPFDFEFRITFKLIGKKLDITYSVKNISNDKIYFSFGGHEGYACPEGADEYFIKFEGDARLTRHMLENGFFNGKCEEIPLEDGIFNIDYKEFEKCTYVFRNINSKSVIFSHKDGKRKLRIGIDGHNTLAIWTLPSRNYVCIEPWCGVSEVKGFNGDITKKDEIVKLDANDVFERCHFIEIL